ncbi:Ectoine dioxygenase [Nocardia sp. RB56]|uniref:Ectoine hydroxylase n=2 Tax=Nocardia aurantia TaxID=2585199 RepID=A0A7K0DR84_9NOCA|nr:ectoine hydroxylase [Nocardia aurantia]MQY28108.1 Ectoine dioxygenase [Nocardia aurantia]
MTATTPEPEPALPIPPTWPVTPDPRAASIEHPMDRYRTRTVAAVPPIDRDDPAVWGEVTTPELAAFDTDGYAIFDELLNPAEVADLAAEVDRLAGDPELRGDERVIVEKASNGVRSIFEVHRLSTVIAELVRQERIVGPARQVLGSEVYIHQSRVNYMPGFSGAGFYWHSDFETWHAEDGMPAPRAVSLSIALTDNFPFNGSLMVMPGSHRTFVACQGETPPENYRESLREQQTGVPDRTALTDLADKHGIAQFTGARGSALLFDSNLLHGSSNNITPFPRSNLFLVFNSVENALDTPYAAPAPRPGYIAARDVVPVR